MLAAVSVSYSAWSKDQGWRLGLGSMVGRCHVHATIVGRIVFEPRIMLLVLKLKHRDIRKDILEYQLSLSIV